MVAVADGEPGTPEICWAETVEADSMSARTNARITDTNDLVLIFSPVNKIDSATDQLPPAGAFSFCLTIDS